MMQKKCGGKCGEVKPLTDFYNKGASGKWQYDCKPCHSRRCTEYQRNRRRVQSRAKYEAPLEKSF